MKSGTDLKLREYCKKYNNNNKTKRKKKLLSKIIQFIFVHQQKTYRGGRYPVKIADSSF